MTRTAIVIPALFALFFGCIEDDPCGFTAIDARLRAARAGEVVSIGACRVRGALVVPAGVVLAGAGRGRTTVELVGGMQAIDLVPSASAETPTTVRDLDVIASAGNGVRVVGVGHAAIIGIGVDVSSGIAVAARDTGGLTIDNVEVDGGLRGDLAMSLPDAAGPDQGGSYGLVLVNVGTAALPATIRELVLHDVGPWGGLVEHGVVRIDGLRLDGAVGIGLQTIDAEVELVDVALDRVMQGGQIRPAMAFVASGAGAITTTRLIVGEIEGIGLLQVGIAGTHRDLEMTSCALGGVWAQDAPSLEIRGASRISGAGIAGIAAVEVARVVIEGAHVEATSRGITIPEGSMGGVEAGDGIVLRGASLVATLRDLVLDGNARVGLLLDARVGGLDGIELTGIAVSTEGDALGAIAQREGALVPPGSWDTAIMRSGTAAANDAALAVPLAVPGRIPVDTIPTPIVD